jgi:hypothetical protein
VPREWGSRMETGCKESLERKMLLYDMLALQRHVIVANLGLFFLRQRIKNVANEDRPAVVRSGALRKFCPETSTPNGFFVPGVAVCDADIVAAGAN